MDISPVRTGNTSVNFASRCAYFTTGCAVTMAELWESQSPFIAAAAVTVRSTIGMLSLRQIEDHHSRKLLAPVFLGATTATFILAWIRLTDMEQAIATYAEQQQLSLWTWMWAYQPMRTYDPYLGWTETPYWNWVRVLRSDWA